jgi:TonB family protein
MEQKIKIQKWIFLLFIAIMVNIANLFAQDVITLKDGKEIIGLVYEIGDVDVKYKKTDNPSGPNYLLKKSEIFMIKYANGSKDTFNDSSPLESTAQISNNEIPEQLIEKAPEFPGGTNALERYLAQNFRYPKRALKKGIQGQVIIRFLIKENDSISDIYLVKRLQRDFDNEAVRLVKIMPKWIPCTVNGKPVKTYYSLMIYFEPNGLNIRVNVN